MPAEQYLCSAAVTLTGQHHYHADRQLYVGSRYLAVCCHCGRVMLITYHGRTETPDLHWMGAGPGSKCGQFQRP